MRSMLSAWLLLAGPAGAVLPVGSVALYSDGQVEKLLAVEGGNQVWEDDRKRLLVRAPNPVVPLLKRENFLSGKGYQQQVSRGDPDTIRGLPPGTGVEFSMLRIFADGRRSVRQWECVLLERTRRSVVGVERPLERYACTRFVAHRKLHNRQFREKREFSYSPELGLIVDLKRQTRDKTSRRKLVEILPPGKTGYKRLRRAVKKLRVPKQK